MGRFGVGRPDIWDQEPRDEQQAGSGQSRKQVNSREGQWVKAQGGMSEMQDGHVDVHTQCCNVESASQSKTERGRVPVAGS